MPKNRIAFVLSDAFLFKKGIGSFLSDKGYEILTSADPKALEKEIIESQANLLLFDIDHCEHTPEKVLASANFIPGCKVILFADALEKEQMTQLSTYGVNGFLVRHCSEKKFLDALAQVEKGKNYQDDLITKHHQETADLFLSLNISEREIEIIKLIAEGYINKEIADRLFLSTHTVNTHRKNIMQKLGINNTAGIVLFAVKQGIVSTNEFLFH